MANHVTVTEPFLPFLESKGWKWFSIIALVYFGLRVLGMLWGWMKYFAKHCCRSGMQGKDKMAKQYLLRAGDKGYVAGEKSWAVVTGGSDGIGFAMCQNLAEQGFNVCMVSRNQDKMNQKLKSIEEACKAKNPSFTWQCKTIVCDFGKVFTIEEYKTTIADQLADLDVAVFALNAGFNEHGVWLGLEDKAVQDTVMLNALQPAYTAKVMGAQLVGRLETKGRKAAMIFVSSAAGQNASPGNLIYCATKTFCSFLGEGLFYEFENKVDVIAYNPASVDTNMNPAEKQESKAGFITAAVAADVAFRDLGCEPQTFGYWSHQNTLAIIGMFPQPMMSRMARDMTIAHHAKLAAEKAKEEAANPTPAPAETEMKVVDAEANNIN